MGIALLVNVEPFDIRGILQNLSCYAISITSQGKMGMTVQRRRLPPNFNNEVSPS